MTTPTRLLIARHGNTFGHGDIVRRVGITDLPLVDSGMQQGLSLGHYLKELGLIPDKIYTSQLSRTMQTAEQIKKVLQIDTPIETLSIFNEIDYGPDENQPEEKVIARIGEHALQEWETVAKVPDGWNVEPNDIINHWRHFSRQIALQYEGKIVLVVTSNGIARFSPYMTEDFHAFTEKHAIKISTGALCIFQKEPSQSVWECIAWNVRPAS